MSGRVFRFAPSSTASREHPHHLFVFLHGCGATAQSMIPIAFKFQARFPSAALVVPSGFDPDARGLSAMIDGWRAFRPRRPCVSDWSSRWQPPEPSCAISGL